MESLELHWLGPRLVQAKGRHVKLETRKAAALLAFLSLHPGDCQREILAAMFWPEGSQQKALANLRRTLSSLNTRLPGWIEADRETISLKRNGRLWVDVEAFQDALSRIPEDGHPAHGEDDDCLAILNEALQYYRGDFLEGLNLLDSPAFDEWQFFQRDGLRQGFAKVLRCLSLAYARHSQWDQAILFARRWLALDRLHEPACRMLMDLYSCSGQRTAALRQYQELAQLLHEQLAQEPEPETRQLYEQILGVEEAEKPASAPERPGSLPLLKTKLYVPTAPASRVVRSRLVECLEEAAQYPLTVLSAPAGFGKTTLLAEWIAGTSLPIAWLSLDKNDNQPGRFLNYLIAAVREADTAIEHEAAGLMVASQQASAETVLTGLINALDSAGGDLVLVLDDYHFISNQAVHDAVAFLIEHCPRAFHLMIATRSDPPLPLARLRARGQAVELRAADLSFSEAEAARFLNDVMGLRLDAKSVSRLKERTEGWIAGLQMAALSMRHREDIPGFIEAFSGTNRYILDYLLEEVLAGQPPEIQRFLLDTSILDRLAAPLCDALLANDQGSETGDEDRSTRPGLPFPGGSAAILKYLDGANLFLMPMDDERTWYRYHHLFADLLRTQLHKSLGAQGVIRLHLRAAAWYEQNGSVLDAIQHASMASDDEQVERLVEQNYVDLVNRGEMSALRFWTGRLSRELVYSRPRLCLYEAQSRSWFGELDEADVLLEAAEKRIRSQMEAPDTDPMLGQLAYVKSRVTAMHGDLPRAIEFNLASREYLPASNLALKMDMGITLGYLYFLNGDYSLASRFLNETVRSGRAVGAILNPVAAACVMARLYANQGLLNKSFELYRQAAQWVYETGGQHLGASSLIEVGMADVLCERNELDSALAHVKQGLASIHLWGKADDLVLACVTAARIHQAQADIPAATEAIERALQTIQTRGVFPEAPGAVELARVRLWLAQGELQAAGHWAASLQDRFDSGDPFRFMNEVTHLARARVWIAQDKPDDALDLLSRLEDLARSAHRMGRVMEILLLRALALRRRGDSEQALLALEECLALAEPEAYVRLFLDEGRPMRQLLVRWLSHAGSGPFRSYALKLLSASDAGPVAAAAPAEKASAAGNLVEPLSQRELEVLQLIALGSTNQQIAGQLIVAPGTVKAHTASIYRKLEAANRTEAVARARQLGILP